MPEYTYADFLNTLSDDGAFVLNALNKHIELHYPEYKPIDIRPKNKTKMEWQLHYRKKPKAGKAICSVYSEGNKLCMRFCLLSSMTYEFLLRQNEFSTKFRTNALKQMICSVANSCRSYGGNTVCPVRQYYWINKRINMACPYPWVSIDDYDENAVADITLFADIQMKHMAQDAKDIKGALYVEEAVRRCKEVHTVSLDKMILKGNTLLIEDHVKKSGRLNIYARLYGLVPMGTHQGLWFSHDAASFCGNATDDNPCTEIPGGYYATVTIDDPFTFSVWRVWNFIAKWLHEKEKDLRAVDLNGKSVPYFVRFYKQGDVEYMAVYVPINE